MKANGKGASPSAPEPKPKRKNPRTTMKSILAQREAERALQPPKPPRPKTVRPPKPEMLTITLQMRHSINGVFYGPGRMTVPKSMAESFLNTEYMAAEKELSLQRQEAFIIGFGPSGPVKRQVPWAQFDTIMSREELPLQSMTGGER